MAVGSLVAVSVGSAVGVALGMAVSVTVGSTVAVAGSSVANKSGSIATVTTRSATSTVSVSKEGERIIVEQVVIKQQPTNKGTPSRANLPKGFVPLNFVNHHLRNLVKKDIVLFTLHELDANSGYNTLQVIPYNPP
ncbi:MAG: hypothetical protein R3C43_17000 [Chloroflexota bacterium]